MWAMVTTMVLFGGLVFLAMRERQRADRCAFKMREMAGALERCGIVETEDNEWGLLIEGVDQPCIVGTLDDALREALTDDEEEWDDDDDEDDDGDMDDWLHAPPRLNCQCTIKSYSLDDPPRRRPAELNDPDRHPSHGERGHA